MKFPQKALYTYNVSDGDSFIVDEKVQLPRIRTNSNSKFEATSPKVYGTSPIFPSSGSKYAVTMAAINPRTFANAGSGGKGKTKSGQRKTAADVARNLFGSSPPSGPSSSGDETTTEANNNDVETSREKHHSAGT